MSLLRSISGLSENISSAEAYGIYVSMCLHFRDEGYDSTRYGFRTKNVSQQSFEKRRDKTFFDRARKKYIKKNDLIEFYLANKILGRGWIGEFEESTHIEWCGRIQRIDYQFKQDLEYLSEVAEMNTMKFDDLLTYNSSISNIPLFKIQGAGKITLETITAIDTLTNFTNQIITEDPLGIISTRALLVKKYKSFLSGNINKNLVKQTIINLFTQ